MCLNKTMQLNAYYLTASYLWNTNATTQSITISSPGTYHVKAQIAECKGYDTILISPRYGISPVFSPADVDTVCPGNSTTFTITNTNCYNSVNWYNNSSSYSLTCTESTPNNYGVTLIDTTNCEVKDTVKVKIHPLPEANISINDTSQCLASNLFVFQDSSVISSGSLSYSWDYAIGDTSGTDSFGVHFSSPDTFAIKLNVESAYGCKDSTFRQIVIIEKPEVLLSSYSNTLCEGLSFCLTDSVSGTTPFSYQWKKNGQVINGATSNTFCLSPLIASDSGIYKYVVENSCGNDSSSNIYLNIVQKPELSLVNENDFKSHKPYIKWQKCYGGSAHDYCFGLNRTTDNFFLFTGFTSSNDYDVSGNNGMKDYWAVKINDLGDTLWQKCFGGSGNEESKDILELYENHYFVTGFSEYGSISGNHGSHDAYSVLFDGNGTLKWQKCVGGSSTDQANCAEKINEYSIVIGGVTYSNNGDISGNHGSSDMWVFKLDKSGSLKWSTCIGGSVAEACYDIIVKDNYIYAIGYTNSSNGNITTSYGGMDILLSKLDTNGNLVWAKTYGGSGYDWGQGICVTHDGLALAGRTSSNNTFINNAKGAYDYFIIEIDTQGNILWKNRYGGSGNDEGWSIKQTQDNGFVFSGASASSDKDVSTNYGTIDYWVIKTNSLGKLEWEINLGGTSNDQSDEIVETKKKEYLVVGRSMSNNIDVSGNHGGNDVWIVKLEETYEKELCVNDSLFINVTADIPGNVNYQWFKNDSLIIGANSDVYSIAHVNLWDSGIYHCVASNMCSSDTLEDIFIYVHPTPVARFSIDDAEQCLHGNVFQFTNSTSINQNDSIYYLWSFGDNSTDSIKNTSHSYSTYDSLQVKLLAYTEFGCADSIEKNVIIRPSPVADFTINDTNQCLPSNLFVFEDSSFIGSGSLSYGWDYAICDTSGTDSFGVHYSSPDTFTIKLNVESAYGCKDSTFKQIVIVEKPTIIAQSQGDTLCEGESICFHVTCTGTKPFTFQWKKNGQNISGASDSFYCISNSEAANSGDYSCVVQNICGTDTSIIINLSVYQSPALHIIPTQSTTTEKPKLIWQKCLGGTSTDAAYSMVAVDDGYIIANTANSTNGQVTGNHGGTDIWIVKLDTASNIVWKKCFGGLYDDWAWSIIKARNEEAYVIAGYSSSSNGDLTKNNGDKDFWIFKIDSVGTLIWQKSYGGSDNEEAESVIQTLDGGYLVVGYSNSDDYDVANNNGYSDVWVLKLSASGNLEWSKVIGDNRNNIAYSVVQDNDSFLYISIATEIIFPKNIYLDLIKTDKHGNVIWKKTNPNNQFYNSWIFPICLTDNNKIAIGGINYLALLDTSGTWICNSPFFNGQAHSILIDQFRNYYIAGINTGTGVEGYKGNTDSYIAKLDKNLNLVWEHCYGGTYNDPALCLTKDKNGNIIFSGETGSTNGDVSNNNGNYDGWVVKLSETIYAEICERDSLILKVSSSGTEPIYYQWFKNGNAINGATSTEYIIPQTSLSDSGWYFCVANNMCGKDTLNQIQVIIHATPTVSFSINDNEQCLNENYFQFTNSTSINQNDSIFYLWSFGDNSIDSVKNTSHSYSAYDSLQVKLLAYTDFGCADSLEKGVIVWPSPIPAFSFNDSDQCLSNNLFVLNNSSTIGYGSLAYQWQFGDSSSTTLSAPTHSYNADDTFTVQLIATSNNSCKDTLTKEVIVFPMPDADFSVNDMDQCLSDNSFYFTDLSSISSGSINYIWYFGDNDTSNSQNATHSYLNFDTFTVKLMVVSGHNCWDSANTDVIAYPNPIAGFDVNDSSQCFYNNVFNFTNSSTIAYGSLAYQWQFGDSTSTTLSAPTHYYNSDDTFTVELKVTSDKGCLDSAYKKTYIHPMPQAVFSINDSAQCLINNQFSFNNSSSINSGTVSYNWDFGDYSGVSSATSPSYSYTFFDTFLVKLLVTSAMDCKDSAYKTTIVFPMPDADFFLNDSAQCFNNNVFSFSNSSSIPHGSLSYVWDFGDNTSTTLSSTSHTYSSDDTFTVSLLATSDQNCMDSAFKTTYVFPNPQISFSINDSDQCFFDHDYVFTNSSTIASGTQSYQWSFGDGDSAFTQNAQHCYDNPDTFTVNLIATSNLDCSDSLDKNIIVFPMPVSAFAIDDSSQCLEGNQFAFTNNSNIPSGNLTYRWDFGDNDTSHLENPQHSYSIFDTITVILITTSGEVCSDTTSRLLVVHPMPIADYFIWDTSQCFERNAFGFTNTSSIPYGTMTYYWRFGDGGIASLKDPVHSYMYPDTFDVHLLATSGNGCTDSTFGFIYIHVHPEPLAAFSINDSTQCLSNNLFEFTNSSTISSGSVDYIWYFGDTDSSNQTHVNHTYLNYDTLNVILLNISDWGCKDSTLKKVIVFPLPEPAFVIDSNSLCLENNIFQFTDTSSIPYGFYSPYWDFGDSTYSFVNNPSHIYSNPDTFEVKLILTSNQSCLDSISYPVYVHPMPNADFIIDDNDQCLYANNFSFTNLSNILSGSFSSFWDYGDGDQSSLEHANHSYLNWDTLTVELKINSAMNCRDSVSNQVVVRPMPVAEFYVNDSSQCLFANSFAFFNTSTVPYGSMSYLWDFRDSHIDTAQSPTHAFANHDTLSVKLLATTQFGCKDSIEQEMYVRPMPESDFSVNDSSQCLFGNDFIFTNQSSIYYGTLSYLWDFQDGITSTQISPDHVYKNYDTFSVKLLLTSNFNCKDSISKLMIVNPMPVADFSVDDSSQCLRSNNFNFTNLSVIPYGQLSYLWNFRDSTFSFAKDTNHMYQDYDNYLVKLIIESALACKDSTEKTLYVRPMPLTDFAINDSTQCLTDNQFVFTNKSLIGYGSLTYNWLFENGAFSTLANPDYSYQMDSSYSIRLISKSNYNCLDTLSKKIVVHPMPEADFSFSYACIADSIIFTDLSTVKNPDTVVAWSWDFKDGGSSILQHPLHTYYASGTYLTQLIVETDKGCFDSTTEKIVIYPDPDAPLIDRATVEEDEYVKIEWLPATQGRPETYVMEKSPDNFNFSHLKDFLPDEVEYNDLAVSVDDLSYTYRLYIIDSCQHLSPLSNIGKSILLKVDTTDQFPVLFWSAYEYWSQGVQEYQVMLSESVSGTYTYLNSVIDSPLSYTEQETNRNQSKYCYSIIAQRNLDNQVSVSNEVCIPTPFRLFVPNSFTPNGDGLNDYFEVKGIFITDFYIVIYNRWGEKMFESDNIENQWDGRFKEKACQLGDYYYHISARGTQTQKKFIKGTITLLR